MSRYLFSGDRKWSDIYPVRIVVYGLMKMATDHREKITIIEGEAPGLDLMARTVAEENDRFVKVNPFPAEWDKYGNAAGPIRNRQMLDEGKPKVVFVFHDDLANSKGTKSMVYLARKAGIPVYHIRRIA